MKNEPIDPVEQTKQKVEKKDKVSDEKKAKHKVSKEPETKHKVSDEEQVKKKKKKKKVTIPDNVCNKCRKSFSNKYNLKKHLKDNICMKPLEERVPKYKCSIENCGHMCHTKSGMRAHELGRHFGVQEHFCPEAGCGKTFTHPSSLNNHKHIAHSEKYGLGYMAAVGHKKSKKDKKKKKKKDTEHESKNKKTPSFSSPERDDE